MKCCFQKTKTKIIKIYIFLALIWILIHVTYALRNYQYAIINIVFSMAPMGTVYQ